MNLGAATQNKQFAKWSLCSGGYYAACVVMNAPVDSDRARLPLRRRLEVNRSYQCLPTHFCVT